MTFHKIPAFSFLLLHLLFCFLTFQLGSCFQDYEQASLDKQNELRAKHKAGPLALDDDLSKKAQACADHYAKKKKMDYTCPEGKEDGQNIAQTWAGKKPNKVEASKHAVDMWYKGKEKYDKKKPDPSKGGAFTQVVWKNSEKLGVGVTQNGDFFYVVSMYSPAGNFKGEFEDNVEL